MSTPPTLQAAPRDDLEFDIEHDDELPAETCDDCGGTGHARWSQRVECYRCCGEGTLS